MPNIYGKYTLTEFANKIGTTAAFINRVQILTRIGGDVGIKGQPASFTDFDVETFRRIKILRKLEFSFDEIKEIWSMENTILKLTPKGDCPPDTKKITMMIHNCLIPQRIPSKDDSPKIDEYEEAVENLKRIIMQVKDRKDLFTKEAEEVVKFANELSIAI